MMERDAERPLPTPARFFPILCRAVVALCWLSPQAASAAPAAPAATDCQTVVTYRLWQESGEKLFTYGADIGVVTGEEAHLYIQVQKDGKTLGTSATVGYPGEFGFSGGVLEVLKKVRMEAQNAADRQYGRIRFTTAEPGGASLGYRIDAVDLPGKLEEVPAACRVGQVNLLVLPPPAPPVVAEPQVLSPREAAEHLVVLLYYGLLRRKIVDQFDEGYVNVVQQRKNAGVELIAQTILESNEFRESAYRRAEERHGPPKRGGKSITELLLGDIYSALYGRARPSKFEIQRDLEDLDICLKGDSAFIKTCGRLGRTLVANPLFHEHNKDLLSALTPAQNGN